MSDALARPRGAWHPGIESSLPRAFLPLVTVYRPENVATPLAEAQELAAFSGLPATELVAFRPERLVVHALLIRVTADLSVPVGQVYGDLGVNFRAIVARIRDAYVAPHAPAIAAAYADLRAQAEARIAAALEEAFAPPAATGAAAPPEGWIARLLGLGRTPRPAPSPPAANDPLERLLARDAAARGAETLEAAVAGALARVASSLVRKHGALARDPALIGRLALTLVLNEEGSRRVGQLIAPWFDEAVAREGYLRLRPQERPVVMNVKGASASGKSTMRPYQRGLAARLGLDWADFAVVTPDIWRKFLLDYEAIGPAYGYAGTLTGHELEIVDRKLDRFMARKAQRGRMSHLLIDRFRFDSFNARSGAQDGSQLLTRFGHQVFLLFMITPPEDTVERAWLRGEQFGRYKAVDDLLAHNVEAFSGMPDLFFTWALAGDKAVTYEFLDNGVRLGERPRTVAFGSGDRLTVLDPKGLLDIERFRKIDVGALCPEAVYPDAAALAPEANTGFLRRCVRRLGEVRFAEQGSGRIYARHRDGRLACLDRAAFDRALADADVRAAFAAIGGARPEAVPDAAEPALDLARDETLTMGAWGPAGC